MKAFTSKAKAFTLIELLIVIAIIAILALIAIPNFLEAQTRSKVSKAKADLRSIAVGMEAYYVDYNDYPILRGYLQQGHTQWNRGGIAMVYDLTTPVAYLSSVRIFEPFYSGHYDRTYDIDGHHLQISATLEFINVKAWAAGTAGDTGVKTAWTGFVLLSIGPDIRKGTNPVTGSDSGLGSYCNLATDTTKSRFATWQYDPTNGTISVGDILRFQ